jgi:hypothetical protein
MIRVLDRQRRVRVSSMVVLEQGLRADALALV